MNRSPKRAFTLIELLVVIVAIAITAAILFPVFARAREAARRTTCLSNEKQIATAVLMYIQDYDEEFPFVLDLSGDDATGDNWGDDNKYPVVPGVTGMDGHAQYHHLEAADRNMYLLAHCGDGLYPGQ